MWARYMSDDVDKDGVEDRLVEGLQCDGDGLLLGAVSRLYLAYISPVSRLYLASISPISRPCLAEGLQRNGDGLLLGTQRGVLGALDPLPGIGEI